MTVFVTAFVAPVLVTGSFRFHRDSGFLGLWAVFWAVLIVPALLGKTEICGNGVWQHGRLHRWDDFESFSWDRKTDESIELKLMPRSLIFTQAPKRLIVLPQDREVVEHLLEANLPQVSV